MPLAAVQSQARVFTAIFFRELAAQHGRHAIGFVLELIEPMFHIGVVCLWHWLVRAMPIYGTSKILFIGSGLYPVFVFIHTSTTFRSSNKKSGVKRRFPAETLLDHIAASAALTLFAYALVGVLFFGGVYVFITPLGVPFDPGNVVAAMAALAVMGLGTGLCNAVFGAIYPVWNHVYSPIARALILFSGVLYVPALMPETHSLRSFLAWNPVLHGVDLFRSGFYPQYPMLIFSLKYLWGCALGVLVLGLVAERALRRLLENS